MVAFKLVHKSRDHADETSMHHYQAVMKRTLKYRTRKLILEYEATKEKPTGSRQNIKMVSLDMCIFPLT